VRIGGGASAAERLVGLAQEHGTPLYVYDLDQLSLNASTMQKALSGVRAQFHFFEFANRNRAILKAVKEFGFGVTIARPAGLARCLSYGFAIEDIEWSGFGLSDQDILLAADRGVTMNVGTPSELQRVSHLCPGLPVGVRVDLGDGVWDKRGIPRSDVVNVIRSTKTMVKGLHTYLGTNISTVEHHVDALEALVALARTLPSDVMADLSYLNVGGGFGYDYVERRAFDWVKYGEGVAPIVRDLEELLGRRLPLKLEVGRALVADCGYLLARTLHSYEKGGRQFTVVDSNLSHFGRPVRYGFHRDVHPFSEDGVHELRFIRSGETTFAETGPAEVAVVGNSHYSKDWFGFARLSTAGAGRLRDSLLLILDVGAYGESMSDQWSDEPRPAVAVMSHTGDRLVSPREPISALVDCLPDAGTDAFLKAALS
jgi:diaminopimelate decarboxylase